MDALEALLERHSPAAGVSASAVPGLDLFRSDQALEWSPVLYEPSLCVLAKGHKEVLVGGETLHYDTAHCALVWIDLPLLCRLPEPCLGLQFHFDPLVVGELLASHSPEPGPQGGAGWIRTPLEPKLLDALVRLAGVLETPDEIPVLAPLLQREITYRVLKGPHGDRLRSVATSGDPAQRVGRAIARLRQDMAEAVLVDELAEEVGLGRSSFHRHFKAITGISPIQYQKRLRLLEAKRLLLTGTTAQAASEQVGYASPAQFNRDYSRLFGAPPRRDVAALLRG